MARARFPGRPLRPAARRRVAVLLPPAQGNEPGEENASAENNGENSSAKPEEPKSATSSGDDPPDSVDASVKTRSQKMQVVKSESDKPATVPAKKTVTFGSVESCGDTFKTIKRVPLKPSRPLVSIIKKKSALKYAEHSFHSIVKPAKLTDLGSKSCLDFSSLRARHNKSPPVKKPSGLFSLGDDDRSSSPVLSNGALSSATGERESDRCKFVLPGHSSRSNRTIKPNKRFIDGDDSSSLQNPLASAKVLKKPKLILNNKSDANGACHDEAYETCDSSANSNDSLDLKSLESASCQNKPISYFDKSLNLFGSASGKSLSASFHDTFVTGLRNVKHAAEKIPVDESESLPNSEATEPPDQSTNERLKDGISRCLLQPSRNVSETPCTSDQSSSSTASESSDSEGSLSTSESEESDAEEKAIPVEKAPAPSQLLSGKVVLREARLQLNGSNNISNNGGADGPFSSFGNNQSSSPTNHPGTVTCGVCGAVRFYRFVRQARKFGIYSCESCRKFISKMLKRLNIAQGSPTSHLQCVSGEGNCRVPPIVRSQQWKLLRCAYKARCQACWLKMCIKAFQIPTNLKTSLQLMLPPNMRPATSKLSPTVNPASLSSFSSISNSNTDSQESVSHTTVKIKSNPSKVSEEEITEKDITESKQNDTKEDVDGENNPNNTRKRRHTRVKVRKKDKISIKQQLDTTKRQKVELKGPRVKHVCRSASIVLGQPIATFPYNEDKNVSDVSDDGSTRAEESAVLETKKKNNSPDQCLSCDSDSRVLTDKDESVTDEDMKMDDINIIKDEETSDSYELTIVHDLNKENEPSLLKSKQILEKDDQQQKQDLDQQIDNAALRKHSKPQPLGTISNVKVSSKQKYNLQRQSELICTDFWESYDPDEVCSTGWGLISSIPFTVNGICFLCGSRGKEKLINCAGCCELYHPFCAEINEDSSPTWLCSRCVQCSGCNRNGTGPASTICRACHRHFHSECLISDPSFKCRNDWPKLCSSCLKCKSCDSFKVTKFLGNLPFCSTCFRLRKKGNYCPLCQGCYQDNDFDSKMMECGWCSRWVHAWCEGLSGEGYQLVSALPQSVEYICKQCLPENAPWRNMMSSYLRGRLMNILKALAKNRNACALLKLTPHKSTPIAKKPCICSSPIAVRKLLFEENSLNGNSIFKSYKMSCSDNNEDGDSSSNKNGASDCTRVDGEFMAALKNDDSNKIKGTVHKLQESLLQNKEICLSMGPCLTKEAAIDQLKEKYRIKDCCVKMKNFSQSLEMECDDNNDNNFDMNHRNMNSAGENLGALQKLNTNATAINNCLCSNKEIEKELSPSLLDIKTRVNSNEYSSVKDFNKDMLDVISKTLSPEVKQIYKDIFTEYFPWFNCELNCLNPSLEIGDDNDDESLKDDEISSLSIKVNEKMNQKINIDEDQAVPSLQCNYKNIDESSYEDESLYDNRICVLCKGVGEGNPAMEERLLYCGQADWIHANCALWSAEVFEEIDGSLQNVQSAIARGKMIKCSKCLNKGASVGCCAKNCSETYHFKCARDVNCALLDDKRVFCPLHIADANDKALQKDNDFVLSRPVYVELDKKKKKYYEPQKVQFILGSLVVNKLGRIIPSVSDFEDFLIPADFFCTRLYWSTKQPWKIVKYTIRTKLLLVEPSPAYDLGVNITLDHSMKPIIVERILAEIDSWHKSLENEGHKLSSKKDKSPIKFGNANVSLEDYAVQQVMEYMLDFVCKQAQNDETTEEEPQNTADLLPPELKDAIFEDLNHDLLDGISMQDIFPKLMSYEDLVAMDMKNEVGFGTEVTKENKNVDNTDDNTVSKNDEKLKKNHPESQILEGKHISQDFLEDILSNQGSKELKKSKSDIAINSPNTKGISGSRNQRASSLALNVKGDNVLSSTIRKCKLPRQGFLTCSNSNNNAVMIIDGTSDLVNSSKLKLEELSNEAKMQWQSKSMKIDNRKNGDADISGSTNLFHKTDVCNDSDNSTDCPTKIDKSSAPNEQVIDFYTKMRCSPISQLDGADDLSTYSDINSPPASPGSPENVDVTFIPQLDGVDDASSSSCSESGSPPRDQNTNVFFRPNTVDNTYTMTISASNVNNIMSGEILMRSPLDDGMMRAGQSEQTVKCDRCHCTYRTKDSFNRHLPTCDLMSTSESEGETPKSPESRTLTTLQNAFNSQFIAPTYINQQNHIYESSEPFNISKPAVVGARRTSVNTRQITINGTIVETQSPGPQSPLKFGGHESNNSHDICNTIAKTSMVHEAPKLTLSQGILSQPQIMVATNMPVTPPRNQTQSNSKCGISQNQNNLPYSICVKPNTGLQAIQSNNPSIAQMFPGPGNIQTVFSSNPNQVLTITNPQQNIIQNLQNKGQIMQTFANMPNGQTIALPVNSIQGLSQQNNGNINAFVRPGMPISNTSAIIMSPHINSPNIQQKNQILLPQVGQKSPKKLQQVQPKPIFQATRGRGRALGKTPTNKRQNKHDKIITNINPNSLGPPGTVIQFQQNNPTAQPSIILQQVPNQNVMSAYVEALQQQHGSNMQYIIAPQGEYKPAPTHFISQGGILPQTFQIQQTESGGLVAVPSGSIPVFLPQGGVGILPQASLQQQGITISSQGNIQAQNGATILPQGTIQTQNGTTIIPQGTIQGLAQGNIQPQTSTLLPNSIQTQGATMVPHNNINSQNILPQNSLQPQNNTLISQQPGTIIPQGAILPQGLQFCNDQVLLGSTPTLEMVTDSSGCMYLTTQPMYYGLETIVQNTVMSSQQFVHSTAMQGVLAQNSSFSATTTQVFQASKIEPIVEMPGGYVVVNNVPQDNIIVSQPNSVNSQTLIATQPMSNNNMSVQQSTPIQVQKTMNKNMQGPNITIQPAVDKHNISSVHRSGTKTISIQPNQPIFSLASPNHVGGTLSLQTLQPRNIAASQGKQNIALQSIQGNIIQSNNIQIPVNVSQAAQCNMPSDNVHLHINQPIISANNSSNNTQAKILPMTQLNNQSNIQEISINNSDSSQIHMQQQTMNGQQILKQNFPQQCWRTNQNFIQTSDQNFIQTSDNNGKNQILTIQSSDSQINIPQRNNSVMSNSNNINLNIINAPRNYTNSFNQPIVNETSMHHKNSQSIGPGSNNMNSNVTQTASSSFGNTIIHNNSTFSMSVPSSMSSNPYMTSNMNQVQLTNSGMNMVFSNNISSNREHSENTSILNESNGNKQHQNSHQGSCNMHRNMTTISDNTNGSSGNMIHLPNNMMNLSLQGGKLYQIPVNSNTAPQVVVNNSMANNIQNSNCNVQMNSTNLNHNVNNLSTNQMNINREQMLNQSNNYQIASNNQVNCINNQINMCNQHQMNISNNQNQQESANVLFQNHHQGIANMHNNNLPNTSSIQIGNCNSGNQIQIISGANNQMQLSNSNMNIGNSNLHNDICNNRQPSNIDHVSVGNNNNNHLNVVTEMNRSINDTHMNNQNDRNHLQSNNMNCVNRIPIPNNLIMNQSQQGNNNSNNQMLSDNSHCDILGTNNNAGGFRVNSEQMFIINNSNPQVSSNNVHNNMNSYQNNMNQSQSSNQTDNQMQPSNVEHNSSPQSLTNQMNTKIVQKQEIYSAKNVISINNPNSGLILPASDSDSSKNLNKQSNTPMLSLSGGNQMEYIQMNNNQILNFPDHNRISISNNMAGQLQNSRNQNMPILTISQNEVISSSQNSSSGSSDIQNKNNDMPTLNLSTINSNHITGPHPPNTINKQIHLPQHNLSNNCINNSMNFSMPVPNMQNFSNLPMQNSSNGNLINLPAQSVNNTISLPVQNTSSISLPKAPSHQVGIPTNVVNPIPQYMRPMNRVLPIHRDAQTAKTPNRAPKQTKVEPPKPSPRCQDMPDLNTKDEEVTDLEKAIRESKSLELKEQKKSEILLTQQEPPVQINIQQTNATESIKSNDLKISQVVLKIASQNNLLTEIENKIPLKALKENVISNQIKSPLQKLDPTKIIKENQALLTSNLKNQALASQRKVQMRSKLGSENNPQIKMSKQPPTGGRIPKDDGPKMVYEVSSEDGFSYTSTSLSDLWNKVLEAVQIAKKQHGLPPVKFSLSQNVSNAYVLGLHNNALKYLVEQLPGASRCMKYRAKHNFQQQSGWDSDIGIFESFRESPWGTARAGPSVRKSSTDMFSWLASPYRDPPPPLTISQDDNIIPRRLTNTTLPMAMRFRHLKETSKHSVGVYRSHIHGRGLFCKRDIEAGEMVIEYAGEVIRAALADKRERVYEALHGGRGVTGCYMFRVDDHLVVDATMKGNAARFINHSCDPNCYSKVVDILGHKHILILALRRIYQGEELTYDYKFPFEEVKIPCSCGAKKCRKYLN